MRNQSGFTLLELIISVVAMAIFGVIVTAFFANSFLSWNRSSADIQLQEENQNVLDTIRTDTAKAAGLLTYSTITDSYCPSSCSSWSASTSGNAILIMDLPAINSAGQPIMKSVEGTANKTPCLNEIIYFKSGNSLFRRTLAASESGCTSGDGNTVVSSCALADGCSNKDKLVSSSVSSITLSGPNANDCNPATSNFYDCPYVGVSVTASKTAFGKTVNLTTDTKMNLEAQTYRRDYYYNDGHSLLELGSGWTGLGTGSRNLLDYAITSQGTCPSGSACPATGGVGTSAPASGYKPYGKIISVEYRVAGTTNNGRGFTTTIEYNNSFITSRAVPTGLNLSWTTYAAIDPPGGSWTWDKIRELEVTHDVAAGSGVVGVSDTEFRVTVL